MFRLQTSDQSGWRSGWEEIKPLVFWWRGKANFTRDTSESDCCAPESWRPELLTQPLWTGTGRVGTVWCAFIWQTHFEIPLFACIVPLVSSQASSQTSRSYMTTPLLSGPTRPQEPFFISEALFCSVTYVIKAPVCRHCFLVAFFL